MISILINSLIYYFINVNICVPLGKDTLCKSDKQQPLPIENISITENAIKCSLKHPRTCRSRIVCHMLKSLLIKIKEVKLFDVHKTFWNTIKIIIRRAIDVLSGTQINMTNNRMPRISLNLQRNERNQNIRNVLKLTDLKCSVPFWFASPELYQISTKKIGEGSFAEIYEIKKQNNERRILKIVPVGNIAPTNKDLQLSFKEISSEICASLELSKLSKGSEYNCSTYPSIYNVSVVQDMFPDTVERAWKIFNLKHKSEHPCPENYSIDQAFIAIETESAGINLDSLKLRCYLKAQSIFKQVAAGLAVAEEKLNFEHRDLHFGNILLKRCAKDEKVKICLRNVIHSIETYGMKATIIDFTYSRLRSGDGVKYLRLDNIYNDKPNSSKKFLDHCYIYSKMAEQTKKRWSTFNPRTNILWLQHILENLLEKVAKGKQSRKTEKCETAAMVTLTIHSRTCLLYKSAAEFVREEILY